MRDLRNGLWFESDSLLNNSSVLRFRSRSSGSDGGRGGEFGGGGRSRGGVEGIVGLKSGFSLSFRFVELFRVFHLQLDSRRRSAKHFGGSDDGSSRREGA